jgi:hypothetical protein
MAKAAFSNKMALFTGKIDWEIPPRAWMFVCCVLSGRSLCDELITRPEEYYRKWRVVVCDQMQSRYPKLKGLSRWATPVAKTQLSDL